jgi:drug/metabolite transporter (DMT)-like permease
MIATSRGWAAIGLVGAMLIWGSSFIAFKVALSVYSPLVVVAARMLVASGVFLLLGKLWMNWEYHAGDWKYLLIMALCEPCLYFLLEAWALEFTTASEAGVMVAVLPLLVAILAGVVLGEEIAKFHWIGLGLTIPGIAWLSMAAAPSESAPNPFLGNMLELAAMFTAAVYTVALRFLSSRYSALFLTAVQAFMGALFFVPLALIFAFEPISWESDAAWSVIYLGSIVTLLAYGLYNHGIKVLNASKATMFTNLIPVFTLIMAYGFLDERINVQQMLAVVAIFSGVLVSQIKTKVPAIPVETF